jgi:hypothetical protein
MKRPADTDRLVLKLAAQHSGEIAVNRPRKARRRAVCTALKDGAFVIPTETVRRLSEAGALSVDAPGKAEVTS